MKRPKTAENFSYTVTPYAPLELLLEIEYHLIKIGAFHQCKTRLPFCVSAEHSTYLTALRSLASRSPCSIVIGFCLFLANF